MTTLTHVCPQCGAEMEIKQNRETGHEFIGCTKWRETGCDETRPLTDDIKLRRAGAMELPGFGDAR